MNLPTSNVLPIHYLSAVFNDATNSYKFYWLLSILNSVKKQETENIILDDLILEMVANVWYPINYFKISFGKQDKLAVKVEAIKKEFELQREITKEELIVLLKKNKNKNNIRRLINDLARYVPYRFLTPWFSSELRGKKETQKERLIFQYTAKYFTDIKIKPLYKFSRERKIINFHPDWVDYFVKHIKILEGFTLWNLCLYLKKHNPNVPNIQEKLFAPIARDLSVARKYWNKYLKNCKEARCIYSNKPFDFSNITIDHFLPWRFVTHDQLWNLLPVSKSINSSKSDNIPSEIYLANFSKLQFDAFHFAINSSTISMRVLEDYSTIFNDTIKTIASISEQRFEEVLTESIKPLMQIAINMGFSCDWIYKK